MTAKTTGWLVSDLNVDVASVRYRAIYPALGLESDGWASILTDDPREIKTRLKELSALVIVKRLDPALIGIAASAYDAGVPIILDLCDDVLSIDYRGDAHEQNRMVFDAIAPRLAAIVTTGEVLKQRFADYGFPAERIFIVPDAIETAALASAGGEFVKKAKAKSGAPAQIVRSIKSKPGGGVAGVAMRAMQAARHPRQSMRDYRRTMNTILTGDVTPPPMTGVTVAEKSAELRKALALDGKTVIWFGNHGGPHSDHGMLTLLRIAKDLRAAYAEVPYTLIVVSDHRVKWKLFLERLGIRTRFVSWTQDAARQLLEKADAFVMPVGQDLFSQAKSSNRALLAYEAGTPVVFQPLDSMSEICDAADTQGTFAARLIEKLRDPQTAHAQAMAANARAAAAYSHERIVALWRDVIETAKAPPKTRRTYGATSDPEKLLVFINLVQDTALALPVIDEAYARGVPVGVLVSAEAAANNPRLLEALIVRRISPTFVERNDLSKRDFRWLRGASALFCPSETDNPAHKLAHALAQIANAAGVKTYTAQHGLENIGLTWRGLSESPTAIASSTIFTWGPPDNLPSFVDPDIRARCVGVGRLTSPPLTMSAKTVLMKQDAAALVAIFENLHWDRFDDDYRRGFEARLKEFASANPQWRIVLAPHPAGLWATKKMAPPKLENFTVIDPRSPDFVEVTADALIHAADAVITTPSTIVADAAEIGRPVGIVAHGRADLEMYQGLTLLENADDWSSFVRDASLASSLMRGQTFLERVRLPGDPAPRIVDIMSPESAVAASGTTTGVTSFRQNAAG